MLWGAIRVAVAGSGDPSRNVLTGGGGRQWLAVTLERFYPLVDDATKLGVDFGLVIAVAARSNDARTLAHEALVLVGPLDDLDVASAVTQRADSLMAFLTSRS